MGKAVRRVRGEAQKNIIRCMDILIGRYSRWEVWQDFIIMSAISIANLFDGPHREAREKEYMTRSGKYSAKEMAVFAQMLAEVVADLEHNPDQDFLGELFMALDLGNEWAGQFFTPYSVCRAMATVSYGEDLKAKIETHGWASVNDPACGAGALLVAFANECRRPKNDVNYQTSVLFVAQDIDFLAGCMCYIQLSLMGCPGYILIGDTIAHPSTSHDPRGLLPVSGSNIWFTPMYFRDIWHWRRIWAQMDIVCRSAAPLGKVEKSALEQPASVEQLLTQTKIGQLAFF
ncbi:N-6 DNA methylase [Anaerotruncus sp.]|jgi:hypothetical protein|uniref:N-6 DNA methylase n=1 Tax=Anaerotruncus sp. TaxID=1872531 RepID=UPI00216BCB7B|nr:N-6 DNA methylase [Anaerotruncus sp.]MCI8493956.1 SAM-dependent DNA methyltransferase [Anaerotruncus sp.]